MDDLGPSLATSRAGDVPGGAMPPAGRRPTPAQRKREAAIDRQLELAAAIGGLLLSVACAGGGAWAAHASWGVARLGAITVLGAVALVGGGALAAHFAATVGHLAHGPGRRVVDPATYAPPEAWVIAVLVGAGAGAATGIDLGTLTLVVGGRTPWGLPPATVMTAVVVLPLVGLLPMAAAAGAAARRAWLRRPVVVAGVAWVAGSVAGSVASGVWSHLPGV